MSTDDGKKIGVVLSDKQIGFILLLQTELKAVSKLLEDFEGFGIGHYYFEDFIVNVSILKDFVKRFRKEDQTKDCLVMTFISIIFVRNQEKENCEKVENDFVLENFSLGIVRENVLFLQN